MIRLLEQVDRTVKEGETLYTYSWILDGASGKQGSIRTKLLQAGWRWIKGRRAGCYVTNDYALASQTLPAVFALPNKIESNGTHASIGAPMYQE